MIRVSLTDTTILSCLEIATKGLVNLKMEENPIIVNSETFIQHKVVYRDFILPRKLIYDDIPEDLKELPLKTVSIGSILKIDDLINLELEQLLKPDVLLRILIALGYSSFSGTLIEAHRLVWLEAHTPIAPHDRSRKDINYLSSLSLQQLKDLVIGSNLERWYTAKLKDDRVAWAWTLNHGYFPSIIATPLSSEDIILLTSPNPYILVLIYRVIVAVKQYHTLDVFSVITKILTLNDSCRRWIIECISKFRYIGRICRIVRDLSGPEPGMVSGLDEESMSRVRSIYPKANDEEDIISEEVNKLKVLLQ